MYDIVVGLIGAELFDSLSPDIQALTILFAFMLCGWIAVRAFRAIGALL